MFGTFSKNLLSLAFQFSIEHGKAIAMHILGLFRLFIPTLKCRLLLGEGTIYITKWLIGLSLSGGFKYFLFSPLPGEMIQSH